MNGELFSIEAEQQLLGSLLGDNAQIGKVATFLKPDHFFDPLHAEIFGHVLRCEAEGLLASPVTLKPIFQTHEGMAQAGGVGYLGKLVAMGATRSALRQFGELIVDYAARRSFNVELEAALGCASGKYAVRRLEFGME
ncbi:DnaB-like helicase N-terminal domain-containing protein [Celeribacter sp.]|uniref:DnaB-like helicase N-terminal domain-containing protein n=1 Tax=Celeribacter sp. TaxID=1890673 RepID=UPI003A947865